MPQQLETVAQSLVDGCLQRVIVGVSTALDTEASGAIPRKGLVRPHWRPSGGQTHSQDWQDWPGETDYCFGHGKVSAFGTGVRQREYIALELLLNLKIILLDGRLLERRINDCGDGRVRSAV